MLRRMNGSELFSLFCSNMYNMPMGYGYIHVYIIYIYINIYIHIDVYEIIYRYMILHISRRVLLPPEDWSSSNASFSYRPWTTVASATHGPWRHRLRAKTVPFRCLESVSDAGSIIGPKWEINMLNTFNALFDFFGSDAARRFSRWCQCMVTQCRRPAPSQQKKTSVCPVVGDLPPIYGKL